MTPEQDRIAELELEVERLTKILNSPLYREFTRAVVREAAHQEWRQGEYRDDMKEPADWFWTLGYLSGKALAAHIAGDRRRALHHTVSSAGVLFHWHQAVLEELGGVEAGPGPVAGGRGGELG